MTNRTGTSSVEPFDTLPSNSVLLTDLRVHTLSVKRQLALPFARFAVLVAVLISVVKIHYPQGLVHRAFIFSLFVLIAFALLLIDILKDARKVLTPVETYAAHLDKKTVLEDALVKRLVRIPEDVLQERKKRLDLEIKFTKNSGSFALLVSALGVINQLFTAAHSSSTPTTAIPLFDRPFGPHVVTIASGLQGSPSTGTSAYIFLMALLGGATFGWFLLVGVSGQLQRLAHVLKRARKERIRLNNRWLV